MSYIEILVLTALVVLIIAAWVLSNIIQDKNEIIKSLHEAIDIHCARGDKWHNEYFVLKGSEAIKPNYKIMLTTDAYDELNIFKECSDD